MLLWHFLLKLAYILPCVYSKYFNQSAHTYSLIILLFFGLKNFLDPWLPVKCHLKTMCMRRMPKCAFGLRQLKTKLLVFVVRSLLVSVEVKIPIHPSFLPSVLLSMYSSVWCPVLDPAIPQKVY